jgi:squalene/oxidosqualene cyclase-like protein
MAYLYGRRFCCDLGPAGAQLRGELHPGGYEAADFSAHRSHVAETDLLSPPHYLVRGLSTIQHHLESWHLHPQRRLALARCLDRIVFEQRATRYLGLSPVNAILNCLALHAADSNHPELEASVEGLREWIWNDRKTGLRLAGARSAAWDTAFALRTLAAGPDEERTRLAVHSGTAFLRSAQLADDVEGSAAVGRERARGGWCFTEGKHRWPVSDCAAEVLSALLEVGSTTGMPALAPDRARDAVDFILSRQNRDGGFGSYERRRVGDWLEALNPSELYADCMTEKSYTECTASCVAALARYRLVGPEPDPAVDRAIDRGVRFLRRRQLPDGSFAGSWGVNFVYATFHVLEAFAAAGLAGDPLVDQAVGWLVARQKPDGGWGEHWRGCLSGKYVEHPESQATMTAWALLALLVAPSPRADAIERGVAFLLRSQDREGGWPRQSPAGVFFRSGALEYTLYRVYFPLWALARANSRLSCEH